MVGVAQLVERQVVALVAVGSSPITHPIFFDLIFCGSLGAAEIEGEVTAFDADLSAPVAQLDRAPDFESVGRGFESLRAYQ